MRRLRHAIERIAYRGEAHRMARLAGRFASERCFLVANGPSLGAMDLSRLNGETVCVVNMGVHALALFKPATAFHVISDNNRYRRFAQDCEDIARQHHITYRFYPFRCRRTWQGLPRHYDRPYFILSSLEPYGPDTIRPDPLAGYSGSVTVLTTAAQILFFAGFSRIYVIGCDLAYTPDKPYFYEMRAKDRLHETDPKVRQRREEMIGANRDLAILRAACEDSGRLIANAGLGGNLDALERVDFASLFT